MALRRDYSLTKDIVFEENEDIVYPLHEKYKPSAIQGQYYKAMLKEYIALYKGICGKGEDINKLFDLLGQYAAMDIADPDYSFFNEADNLRNAIYGTTEYNKSLDLLNKELSRMIDGWLSSVDSKVINPQQRKQELVFIGQAEQILNRRSFLYGSKMILNTLMQGLLQEGYPEEEKISDSTYSSINLPMMTHIPYVDDLDESELVYNPLIQVLYNIVAVNSYIPISLLHDYDNGNVCVRLWRKEQEEYVPFYTSVAKSEVYADKIGYANQKSIWPGIIEAAFAGYGIPETKEEIVEALLGPNASKYDMERLCGDNIRPADNWSKELNEVIHSYVTCLYDIYSAFLLTCSLVTEDELPYVKLQYGIKECMEMVSSCMGQTLEQAKDVVEGLSNLIAEYRESVASQNSSTTVQKRLSVCDTAEELLELYNSDSEYHLQPHSYFEKFLAEKIVKIILSESNKELTQEAIDRKVNDILKDSVFRQETSKMNIHMLKNAGEKFAEHVLAKMERRIV